MGSAVLDIVLGPTFDVTLDSTSDEAEGVLADWIRGGGCPFHAVRVGSHFTFETPTGSRHFWSPTLTLDVREEDGRAVLHGRFNPSHAIWTAYMFTYLALVTIILGASMWGLAELILHRTPWALAFIPVCALIGAVMFWASAVGQRLARPEMKAMHAALCGVLGVEGEPPPCCAG